MARIADMGITNKVIKLSKQDEQHKYPFGYWQYRRVGGHYWTNAKRGESPLFNSSLYYKRGGYFTYINMGVEWRWMR